MRIVQRILLALAAITGASPACSDGGDTHAHAQPVQPEEPRNSDGSRQVLPPGPPSRPPYTVVLAYDDFGPQALAGTLIGPQWWQWEAGGSWEPEDRFDIRVVVYRGLTAQEVAREYPTVKGEADYRYVTHDQAMAHFARAMAEIKGEPSLQQLHVQLQATRARVRRALGSVDAP